MALDTLEDETLESDVKTKEDDDDDNNNNHVHRLKNRPQSDRMQLYPERQHQVLKCALQNNKMYPLAPWQQSADEQF